MKTKVSKTLGNGACLPSPSAPTPNPFFPLHHYLIYFLTKMVISCGIEVFLPQSMTEGHMYTSKYAGDFQKG